MKNERKLTVDRVVTEVLREAVERDKQSRFQTTRDRAEGIEFALNVLKLPKETKAV